MREILKKHLKSTALIYIMIYLIATFVLWEFRNPFQWIIDIPTYDEKSRFAILFCYAFYTATSLVIISESKKK